MNPCFPPFVFCYSLSKKTSIVLLYVTSQCQCIVSNIYTVLVKTQTCTSTSMIQNIKGHAVQVHQYFGQILNSIWRCQSIKTWWAFAILPGFVHSKWNGLENKINVKIQNCMPQVYPIINQSLIWHLKRQTCKTKIHCQLLDMEAHVMSY